MMYLRSNQDLYEYLVHLNRNLETRRAVALAESVARAIGSAAGLSTEFLREARIALQHVALEGKQVLALSERADLENVVQQLTAALDRAPQTH